MMAYSMNTEFNILDVTFHYLTPSNKAINDAGGMITFNGRRWTYFNRIGIFLARQIQKIKNCFRPDSEKRILTNNDAMFFLENYTASINYFSDKEILTIQNTIIKIKQLSPCISREIELIRYQNLLNRTENLLKSALFIKSSNDKVKGLAKGFSGFISAIAPSKMKKEATQLKQEAQAAVHHTRQGNITGAAFCVLSSLARNSMSIIKLFDPTVREAVRLDKLQYKAS